MHPNDLDPVQKSVHRNMKRIDAQREDFFKKHRLEHPTNQPNCKVCDDMEYYK